MNLTAAQKKTVLASFLGWTLDAFDFFLLTFLLKDIAKEFNVEVPAVSYALFLTLAMRFVGAFIFGRIGDHLGAQARVDARHRLLFRGRRRRRFRAELDGLPGAARAVRRRHGRRMGSWQFAGDGVDPAAGARLRLGPVAMRLSHRLPARRRGLWPVRWAHHRRLCRGMAGAVPAVGASGARRAVHPLATSRNRRRSPTRRKSSSRVCGNRSRPIGGW